MLIKALGGIDLAACIILIASTSFSISDKILILFGVLLFLKSSLTLLKDFAGWIDFAGGITFILMTFVSVPGLFLVIVGIFLFQKGIISFL